MYKITNTTASAQNNVVEVTVTEDMLSNMTKEQREVVEMRMMGISFRIISNQLGLSEMAVRTRYNRAFDAVLSGKTATQSSSNNIAGLTDEQVARFELLIELKSIQKVADRVGIVQMAVRNSLGRAAIKLGCTDIWSALAKYIELKEQAAKDAHGTQLGFDLSEVGTIETAAPVEEKPKRGARK